MIAGRVGRLRRYPVQSMLGEDVPVARVTVRGRAAGAAGTPVRLLGD